MQEFAYILEETPLALLLLAAIAAGLFLGVFAIVLGARRGRHVRALTAIVEAGTDSAARRFSAWTEIGAVVGALLIPAAVALIVSISRDQAINGILHSDPSLKATSLAAGIAGQLNGICLGAMAALLQLPLSAVGLGLALAHRARAAGLRRARALSAAGDATASHAYVAHPGPGVVQVLAVTLGAAGLVASPLVYGVLSWGTGLIQGFAAVAGVDPAHKGKLLLMAMQEAQVLLDRWLWISGAGLVIVAILAVVLLVLKGAWRQRRALAPSLFAGPELSARGFALGLGGCLLGAAGCLFLAWPLRQENLSPLPVSNEGTMVFPSAKVETPALRGPDPVERAPVLEVSPGRILLDGSIIERPDQLREQLEIKRHNWLMTNPDRDFPGRLLLHVDRRVQVGVLLPLLLEAHRVQSPRLTLVFAERRMLKRPRLGLLPQIVSSGARLTLLTKAPAGTVTRVVAGSPPVLPRASTITLSVSPDVTFKRFAEVVVRARQSSSVQLFVPPLTGAP